VGELGGDGMSWQNDGFKPHDATFIAVYGEANLHGLATLRLRARRARDGQNPTTNGLPDDDDGEDSDSTPAS
jgi:hypothetical protein